MSVNENSSDEENEDITKQSSDTHNLNQLFPIKIKNKTIKLRKHRKVIRFVNYKYKVDPENYGEKNYYYTFLGNKMNLRF